MNAKSLLVGILGLGSLGVAGCSSALNMAAIETEIQADIERQGRRLALREVLCPEDVTPQAGAFFRCVGELEPEGTFTINVTQTDSQGNVTWDVPNSRVLLNLAKVETNIQEGLGKALGKRALIDCGSELFRVNQPGDRFECAIVGGITVGPDAFTSVLVKVDPEGNLNWQELRQGPQTATIAGALPTSQPGSQGIPSAESTAPTAVPTPAPVQSTTLTGPTGRPITRPYVPGDDD